MEGVGDLSALTAADLSEQQREFEASVRTGSVSSQPSGGEVEEHPVCRHCGRAIAWHPMGWIHSLSGSRNCNVTSPMAEPA